MSNQISIKYKEKVGNDSIYLIGQTEVQREIYDLSINPLRILCYLLGKKNIEYKKMLSGESPNSIEKVFIAEESAKIAELMLTEVLEYRCSIEAANNHKEIIRQLPFEVLMQTSESIMNFGKSKSDILMDNEISRRAWRQYNGMLDDSNPNDTVDNLTIPKESPVLRKHAIYASTRGGYNIKTLGYSDSSLDHHCYMDSRRWD